MGTAARVLELGIGACCVRILPCSAYARRAGGCAKVASRGRSGLPCSVRQTYAAT